MGKIGKRIKDRLYLHVSALSTLDEKEMSKIIKSKSLLPKDFIYNIICLNLKKDWVAFIFSPDWEDSFNPISGDRYVVIDFKRLVFVKQALKNPLIFHRRYLFVKEDYHGFNIKEDKSHCDWWSALKYDKNKMGRKEWWEDFLKGHK